jgi:hypothetical protein
LANDCRRFAVEYIDRSPGLSNRPEIRLTALLVTSSCPVGTRLVQERTSFKYDIHGSLSIKKAKTDKILLIVIYSVRTISKNSQILPASLNRRPGPGGLEPKPDYFLI